MSQLKLVRFKEGKQHYEGDVTYINAVGKKSCTMAKET